MEHRKTRNGGYRRRMSSKAVFAHIGGRLFLAFLFAGFAAAAILFIRGDRFSDKVLFNRVRQSAGALHVDGMFIGKRGYLMEDILPASDQVIKEKTEAVNQFADRHTDMPVSVMLVPNKASILRNRLPVTADVADQQQIFGLVKDGLDSRIAWIDVSPTLRSHRMEDIYYKTDSRWTSLGAAYAAEAAAGELGLPDQIQSGFAVYTLTRKFEGDLAKKSGLSVRAEEASIYVPKEIDKSVLLTEPYSGIRRTTLYNTDALETDEPYNVFPASDSPLTDIRTMTASGKSLLLVQDSFGSALIPFLAPYYREIVAVSPDRFWEKADQLVEDYKVDECLFVYSGNQFVSDTSLVDFLGEK